MPKNYSYWLGQEKVPFIRKIGSVWCVSQAMARDDESHSDATVKVSGRKRRFQAIEAIKATRRLPFRWDDFIRERYGGKMPKSAYYKWRASRSVRIFEDPRYVRYKNRSRIFNPPPKPAKQGTPLSIRVRKRGNRSRDKVARASRVALRQLDRAWGVEAVRRAVQYGWDLPKQGSIPGASHATIKKLVEGGRTVQNPTRVERAEARLDQIRFGPTKKQAKRLAAEAMRERTRGWFMEPAPFKPVVAPVAAPVLKRGNIDKYGDLHPCRCRPFPFFCTCFDEYYEYYDSLSGRKVYKLRL